MSSSGAQKNGFKKLDKVKYGLRTIDKVMLENANINVIIKD